MEVINSDVLKAIKEIDRSQCVKYMTEQLIKLGFTEYSDGCFIYGTDFKVVFSVGDISDVSCMPMQVIHKPDGGAERKYAEYLSLYSIAQIMQAYTKLTGKPL